MDFRQQQALLRSSIWLLLACALIAGIAAAVVTFVLPTSYTAQATLDVGESLTSANPDYNELLASQQLAQTYAQVASTRPILQQVVDQLRLATTVDQLAGDVSAKAASSSTILTISAQDSKPDRAAAIANALAQTLINSSRGAQGQPAGQDAFILAQLAATQQQIQSTEALIDRLNALASPPPAQQQQLQAAEADLAGLRSTYVSLLGYSSSSSANQLTVVQSAVAPIPPTRLHDALIVLLAAFVGLLLGVVAANVRAALDDSLSSPAEVESTLGLATLGAVRGFHRRRGASMPLVLKEPHSVGAESFRLLRTSVAAALDQEGAHILLITSAAPSEGKSTVAANLAVSFAQIGRRIVLVDANLRRPTLHAAFGLHNTVGLSSLLRRDLVVRNAVMQPIAGLPLVVVTSGPLIPDPAEALASTVAGEAFANLRAACDLIIVDSPPMQAVSDGAELAKLADATLLVVAATHTRPATVQRACETLQRVGARVVGVVLNGIPASSASDYFFRYASQKSPVVSGSPAPARNDDRGLESER